MFACLRTPDSGIAAAPPDALLRALRRHSPRVTAGEGPGGACLWVDAWGLPAAWLALECADVLERHGASGARVGIAAVPVAAWVATFADSSPTIVELGREGEFMERYPIAVLGPGRRLRGLLDSLGFNDISQLAALEGAAVETALGREGFALWKLARAVDPRPIFGPIPEVRPAAHVDLLEYSITDREFLLRAAAPLIDQLLVEVRNRRSAASRLRWVLALDDRTTVRRSIRVVRASADGDTWNRRLRDVAERLDLRQGVSGMALSVMDMEVPGTRQPDLFDPGAGTAEYAESAAIRIEEGGLGHFSLPTPTEAPLPEARRLWAELDALSALERTGQKTASCVALSLRLEREATPIAVRTVNGRPQAIRRGRGHWETVSDALGPQRLSSAGEDDDRDYYVLVTEDALLWAYRQTATDSWFLHGHWD